MRFAKTAIIGAGSWGTALAWLWAQDNRKICLWSHNAARAARLENSRENTDDMAGVTLPESVRVTPNIRHCADADLIVFVTPSTALRAIAAELRAVLGNQQAVLLSCTKGIENGTGMRMSEVLGDLFPQCKIAVLSGPNLAIEVVRGAPTATVVACADDGCARELQSFLGSSRFRIYTSNDVASVELGGALKNVFAIAAGASDGLGFGDNTKAALVTRSLAELVRLGSAMGGNVQTFYGLSGLGDLIATCFSRHSRNRRVGEYLGRGESLQKITSKMQMVAEGIPTAKSAFECARKLNVETPIIDQVYAILYEGKKPTAALEELLQREQKPEQL